MRENAVDVVATAAIVDVIAIVVDAAAVAIFDVVVAVATLVVVVGMGRCHTNARKSMLQSSL